MSLELQEIKEDPINDPVNDPINDPISDPINDPINDPRDINYLHLVSVEDNLDKLLGFYYWKRYIASAFWSNISTPINLAITLMTAMTTAQATTLNLFSNIVLRLR